MQKVEGARSSAKSGSIVPTNDSPAARIEQALAHTEAALDQKNELLQVTLSSIGDGVITTDSNGRVTSMNPVAEGLTCWTQKDATGLPLDEIFRIINETTRAPAENPALRALREGHIVGLANHTVLVAKDGVERAIDDSASPIRDKSGNILGVVLIFRDVTSRRQAEEAQFHLAAVVASSDDAIVSKNLDGIIRSWNAGAEQLFGHTAKEAIGQHITMIIPNERLDEERVILAKLRRGERIDHFETVRIAKDGRLIDVSLTVSPVRDHEGRIIGASKVARDITERKRAEAIMKENDRRKDEFLATLAHELRNPLAPVRNAVDIMYGMESAPPEIQWAREMIDRQVKQMTRLIDDLMDVSRITRGKVELRTEMIELATVVSHAVESARALVQCKHHEFSVVLPAERIVVNGDLARLSQIVGNLLNNACKFTDRGGQILLSVHGESDQAIIRVRDTGIGIASEQLPHIFNMFTQLDTSLERSQSGLGIGLALAKRLVELHGGTIEASSAGPKKGTEFVVRLPMAPVQQGGYSPPKDADVRHARTFRILVVDDNRDAAVGLGKLLRSQGHEVRTAHDGEEALAVATEFRPEVVLLDIGLPKVNGFDVARKIRSERGKEVILIAVTGWGQPTDRRRSREAGFDYHVTKPVEISELKQILASLVLPVD